MDLKRVHMDCELLIPPDNTKYEHTGASFQNFALGRAVIFSIYHLRRESAAVTNLTNTYLLD